MSNIGSSKQTQNSMSQVRPAGFIEPTIANASYAAQQQAFGGAPESYVTSQARNLAGQTLRGDFLSPESNPYLAGTANLIGDQVFGQTANRFAGAGRGVGGANAQGQFRDDLTDRLAPLYGDNLARERGIQANTMGMSSQFDPLNQLISRLGPLSDMAGRTISTSGTTRDRASPLDTFLGLFG
jgi:hypothetical protein